MNGDSEEDVLVDDWITSKQDLLDTSDEELNDDLLCSDDENETMRCHSESIPKPKLQAIAKPYLVCETPHLAEDQARCPKEDLEVDPGEVLDIEINAPSGDEFQQEVADYSDHQQADIKMVSSLPMQEPREGESKLRDGLSPQPSGHHLTHSCRGQPAPEETLSGPSRSREPVFPGQHMFDQQHSASVLDTNPLLSGPTPMGSIQPPGNESDPWRPSLALQGPSDLSKPGTPHRGQKPLQKHPSAQSGCSFTAPSGPQAQKPAVLVRAVARMVQSAKPMAVARGMPIAARQPASAKSKLSAKTPPAPGMVGRNVGQKVKVQPQTPPAAQKLPAKLLNMTNNKEFCYPQCEEEEVFYMEKLQEQMRLREQVIKQKELMRSRRAANKKHLRQERFQTDSSTGNWNNNLNQQKQPCVLGSCPRKVTHQQPFHNPPHSLVLERLPEIQPLLSQQHQDQVVMPPLQPPWQQALPTRGNPSGRAAELQHNQPHQRGTDRVVLEGTEQVPDQMNQQYRVDEVWRGLKKKCETRTFDGPVPTKIRVVKQLSPVSVNCDLAPQMSEEINAVTKAKPRVVTFRMPDSSPPSFLQHSLKLNCPKQGRESDPNQPQDEVAVRGNQHSAFIPFRSGLRTEPVTAQTHVNFIVRLNR
ncbi:RNA-binding protein 33 [Puntigrus tetrazona]|uniref:RNA-binding protein 33 n=1 Tax=Puntigrus tetrazona TaxID=1606681 RepID=UPI001C8A3CB0|nr:RNA-binding protein 33 [Puntigrus tetrazona]